MCTKILLEQLEKMPFNGQNALEGPEWRLSFALDPWTKGLAVTLQLRRVVPPQDLLCRLKRTIVLRRGQEPKLVRNLLQLWVSRPGIEVRPAWLDKKVDASTRIGPEIHRFVLAVMSKYVDGSEVARDRALNDLRRAVLKAQDSGLTEQDLKVAWDEGLVAKMLAS